MQQAREYLRQAAECQEISDQAKDPQEKAQWAERAVLFRQKADAVRDQGSDDAKALHIKDRAKSR